MPLRPAGLCYREFSGLGASARPVPFVSFAGGFAGRRAWPSSSSWALFISSRPTSGANQ